MRYKTIWIINSNVDQLLTKVKTAKELIGICEKKLQRADLEISEVLKDIRKNDQAEERSDPSFSTDGVDEFPFDACPRVSKEEIPF